MNADLANFIGKEAFYMILKDQLGWFVSDKVKVIENLVCIKPDFYETPFVLATSKKAVIGVEGYTEVIIDGKKYNSVSKAIEEKGQNILESFSDWKWLVEKEWVIRKTKDNEWVTSCTILSDFPYRKQVKC